MATKSKPKPPMTDAERHKHFLEMAQEIGASDDAKAFDRAFQRVVKPKKAKSPKR